MLTDPRFGPLARTGGEWYQLFIVFWQTLLMCSKTLIAQFSSGSSVTGTENFWSNSSVRKSKELRLRGRNRSCSGFSARSAGVGPCSPASRPRLLLFSPRCDGRIPRYLSPRTNPDYTAEQRRQTSGQDGKNRLQTLLVPSALPRSRFVGGRGVRVSAGPLCGPSPNSGY